MTRRLRARTTRPRRPAEPLSPPEHDTDRRSTLSDQTSPAGGRHAADQTASWRDQQRETAAAHAELLATRQRAEAGAAREQIAGFLRRVRSQKFGPEPVELRAHSYDGNARYKTPLTGWYLRKDETVAIDTEGNFYVLT